MRLESSERKQGEKRKPTHNPHNPPPVDLYPGWTSGMRHRTNRSALVSDTLAKLWCIDRGKGQRRHSRRQKANIPPPKKVPGDKRSYQSSASANNKKLKGHVINCWWFRRDLFNYFKVMGSKLTVSRDYIRKIKEFIAFQLSVVWIVEIKIAFYWNYYYWKSFQLNGLKASAAIKWKTDLIELKVLLLNIIIRPRKFMFLHINTYFSIFWPFR